MIKGAVQLRVVVYIIKIGEYLSWKQPEAVEELINSLTPFPATIDNDYIDDSDVGDFITHAQWKAIMEEPPKPGIGGD